MIQKKNLFIFRDFNQLRANTNKGYISHENIRIHVYMCWKDQIPDVGYIAHV